MKMSGVPSPRVRKPKPRSRLNHFTIARSYVPSAVTVTWVRAGGRLGRVRGGGIVERKHAEGLVTASTLNDLANDARAFLRGLESVAPQAGHMQQNVRHAIVRNDEAITLGDIEPLDDA
jgi:hypothetical protein